MKKMSYNSTQVQTLKNDPLYHMEFEIFFEEMSYFLKKCIKKTGYMLSLHSPIDMMTEQINTTFRKMTLASCLSSILRRQSMIQVIQATETALFIVL